MLFISIKFCGCLLLKVFTVEEQNLHLTDVKGACCKNLFLKDKKKNLYLLSCLSNAQVNLKDISKSLGIAGILSLV